MCMVCGMYVCGVYVVCVWCVICVYICDMGVCVCVCGVCGVCVCVVGCVYLCVVYVWCVCGVICGLPVQCVMKMWDFAYKLARIRVGDGRALKKAQDVSRNGAFQATVQVARHPAARPTTEAEHPTWPPHSQASGLSRIVGKT